MPTQMTTYTQRAVAIQASTSNSLQTQAYQKLLSKIIHAEYQPGAKLDIKNLMAELDLGRTPVREAVVRLTQQGYIYVLPQSGTFVSRIDMELAEQARFIRDQLEQQIVLEACAQIGKADLKKLEKNLNKQKRYLDAQDKRNFFDTERQFHELIFVIAKRIPVWYWLESAEVHLERYRWLHLQVDDQYASNIYEQHEKILEAFNRSKADDLKFLIGLYMRYACYNVEKVRAQYPEYFEESSF